MEKIVTEYSLWYLPVCILTGLAYALILYYKESDNEFSKNLRIVLGGIRLVLISLIAFLLLNPLIQSILTESEKPTVLILHDNSESVTMGKDSSFYKNDFKQEVRDFMQSVEAQYEVRSFLFGEELREGLSADFSDQQTNIGSAFSSIYDRFAHKNIGALVLLSDGINNLGVNPIYGNYNFSFPVYTVALGDTMVRRDLILNNLNYNRIAYQNNEFPIEINLIAKKSSGLSSRVIIERNGEILFDETVDFLADNEFRSIQTSLPAEEPGLLKYTARILPVADEISLINNTLDFFVDVLEDKQSILLLANAPHPDVSAIKQVIQENINYELEDFLIGEFSGAVDAYNLVILHGLPSARNNSSSLLSELKEKEIPTLFIYTNNTFLPLFNEQETGIIINPEDLIYNEAEPYVNPDFNLFNLDDETRDGFLLYPPLNSPYGRFLLSPSATPLLYQQIGSVATDQPLWVFNQNLDRKTSVIMGPGLWRWRIKEFVANGSHIRFDDIFSKAIQYLALRIDKSLFRIYSKTSFQENMNIEFEAELYNDVYELVNDKDVNITITGSDGTSYPFSFTTTSRAYYLNAGNLPSDSYTYLAQVNTGNGFLEERGEFTVSTVRLEQLDSEADHNLLYTLAQKYGGSMVYPDGLSELSEEITARDDIKTINYYQKRFTELLNLPWLLGLILLLLSAEWFVRKRAGGY